MANSAGNYIFAVQNHLVLTRAPDIAGLYRFVRTCRELSVCQCDINIPIDVLACENHVVKDAAAIVLTAHQSCAGRT